jgi:hypothetical protein
LFDHFVISSLVEFIVVTSVVAVDPKGFHRHYDTK